MHAYLRGAFNDTPGTGVLELDSPMKDGVRLKARAILAECVLRRRSVDHSLRWPEYLHWLCDPLAICGVGCATIDPGYVPPVDAG